MTVPSTAVTRWLRKRGPVHEPMVPRAVLSVACRCVRSGRLERDRIERPRVLVAA